MKTCLVTMSILLVAVGAGAQPAGPTVRVGGPGEPVAIRMPIEPTVIASLPYSAEVETNAVQMLADGNRIVKHTTGRVSRDAAGRVRREEDRPSQAPWVTIVDPVGRMTYSVDAESRILWRSKMPATPVPDLEAATKSRLAALRSMLGGSPTTPEAAARMEVMKSVVEWLDAQRVTLAKRGAGLPESVNTPVTDEELPGTTIDGLRAEGRRRTIAIPAGAIGNERPITIVSEEWNSPDLKVLLMTRHSDPRIGESTYRLRSINRSTPAASLFQIPTDYSVRDWDMKRP